MAKYKAPVGFHNQAYRFEVDRPSRYPAIASHQGARRFAWNFMLGVIEEQCRAREVFRLLAIRQGASTEEAQLWAESACSIPYLIELNEKSLKDHEAKVSSGKHKGSYQPVSEWCPWTKDAMRYLWNRIKDEVAPWWAENSKECYSSAFESLARAFHDHFSSRDGTRRGLPVGWPKPKRRSGRQSVGFTTGGIEILDRHHVQLPVVGVLRVKEPTNKLRCKLITKDARILRANLVTEGTKTYVSFTVEVRNKPQIKQTASVCGHDVGISVLITSSDGKVTKNQRAEKKTRKKISRYQRRMDRQHRTASPACFDDKGRHIQGRCYWKNRSKRAQENQQRLAKTHARAARISKDAIHKASHNAASTYKVNITEDLRVGQMGKKGYGKRGFNRVLQDAALAELRRQLTYKCSWYGSVLWLASWWYPSSKTCSQCQVKNPKLSRSTRMFHCEHCGLVIDRDLNAAKNLAALAELACVCHGTVCNRISG